MRMIHRDEEPGPFEGTCFPHPLDAGILLNNSRPLPGRRAQSKLDERAGFLALGVAFAQTSLSCGGVDAGMHIRRGFHQTELSSRGLPRPHIRDGCFGCLPSPFLEADILNS